MKPSDSDLISETYLILCFDCVACGESLLRLLLLSFTSEFGVRFFGIC